MNSLNIVHCCIVSEYGNAIGDQFKDTAIDEVSFETCNIDALYYIRSWFDRNQRSLLNIFKEDSFLKISDYFHELNEYLEEY